MKRCSSLHGGWNRREFLAGSATAAAVFPAVTASNQKAVPEESIGIGFIGLGYRGFRLMTLLREEAGVAIGSCGDLWAPRLERVREIGFARHHLTPMYVKVINSGTVDAVVVSLPDHNQANVLSAVIRMGKPVYIEVPATRNWAEWSALEDEFARVPKSLVFWGCQQQSNPAVLAAAEWVKAGKVGEVLSVTAEMSGFFGGYSPAPPNQRLEDRKWSWFQAESKPVPYDPDRLFNWARYPEYSAGPALRHFQHLLGAIQPVTGLPEECSVNAQALRSGGAGSGSVPDIVTASFSSQGSPSITLLGIDRPETPRIRVTFTGREASIVLDSSGIYLLRKSPWIGSAFAWPETMQRELAKRLGITSKPLEPQDEGLAAALEEKQFAESATLSHLRRFVAEIKAGTSGFLFAAHRHSELLGHAARTAYETGEPVRTTQLQSRKPPGA